MAVGGSLRAMSRSSLAAARSIGAAFDVWVPLGSRLLRSFAGLKPGCVRCWISRALTHRSTSAVSLDPGGHNTAPCRPSRRQQAHVDGDLAATFTDRDLPALRSNASLLADPSADCCVVVTRSGPAPEPPARQEFFSMIAMRLRLYDALEMFRFRGPAAPVEMAARLLAGERFAMVAATGGHFAGAAMVERMRRAYPWLASNLRVFSLLQPLPELVAQLNAFRPTLLATYPTAADLLACEKAGRRLSIAPSESGPEASASCLQRGLG